METATKPKLDSGTLLAELTKSLRDKPPEIQQRVLAHVRAVSGHATIPSYHSNGASESEKKALYAECILAIRRNDFSGLKGQVASGQAVAETAPAPAPKPKPASHIPPATKKPAVKAIATSYKVGCKTKGDKDWSYNALRFESAEAAEAYGNDLASRWMALDKYEVHPSEEPVNYRNGKFLDNEKSETVDNKTSQDAPGASEGVSEPAEVEKPAPTPESAKPPVATGGIGVIVLDHKSGAEALATGKLPEPAFEPMPPTILNNPPPGGWKDEDKVPHSTKENCSSCGRKLDFTWVYPKPTRFTCANCAARPLPEPPPDPVAAALEALKTAIKQPAAVPAPSIDRKQIEELVEKLIESKLPGLWAEVDKHIREQVEKAINSEIELRVKTAAHDMKWHLFKEFERVTADYKRKLATNIAEAIEES